MKKILVVVIGMLFTGSVMAAHGPAGCGLGELLFKGKKGLMFNVLAATFNGTSGNQTFGMSTGTLGCQDAQTAKVAAVSFVENNMVALSNDISKGEGQTLNAYLTLIGAESTNRTALKSNFARIFAEGNTAQTVHNTITELVQL